QLLARADIAVVGGDLVVVPRRDVEVLDAVQRELAEDKAGRIVAVEAHGVVAEAAKDLVAAVEIAVHGEDIVAAQTAEGVAAAAGAVEAVVVGAAPERIVAAAIPEAEGAVGFGRAVELDLACAADTLTVDIQVLARRHDAIGHAERVGVVVEQSQRLDALHRG